MHRDQSVFLGFADQREGGKVLNRAYAAVGMFYVVPVAALLILDIADRLVWVRALLVLSPLLTLDSQIRIWFSHIRRFGMPPLRHLGQTLKLDELRGYDPFSNSIRPGGRRHFASIVIAAGVIGSLGWVTWRWTHFSVGLYFSAFALMVAFKGTVRRSRPPAILILGASGSDISSLQLRIMKVANPLITVACLRYSQMAPVLENVLQFFSYRTGSNAQWQVMVRGLIEVSQVVVFDLRHWTEPVSFEIGWVKALVPPERLFVLEGSTEHDLPGDRCFTEGGIIEEIHTFLWGSTAPLSHGKKDGRRWTDNRNHYFAVVAPPSWTSHEYDDPRSKVKFTHPRASEVNVTLIAREAADPGHEPSADTMHRAREMGWACTVGETDILGVPCSEVVIEAAGSYYSRLWIFVIHGIHFTISFGAPTEEMFTRHFPEVRRALDTIEILKPPVGNATTRSRQKLANELRYARLAVSTFGIDEAIRSLKELRLDFISDPHALSQIDALLTEISSTRQGDN